MGAKISERIKRAAGDLTGRDSAKRSRDDLYEEARRLGIRGRSKMSEEELAREIAARR